MVTSNHTEALQSMLTVKSKLLSAGEAWYTWLACSAWQRASVAGQALDDVDELT